MHKEEDLRFLKRRQKFVASWNAVGTMLFAVLIGLLGWLLVSTPYLVNPFHVYRQLLAGTIERSTLELMAVLLPVVVLAIFAVIAVVIGYGFAVFSNERRYHRIIDNLRARTGEEEKPNC